MERLRQNCVRVSECQPQPQPQAQREADRSAGSLVVPAARRASRGRESAWERLPIRVPASAFGPGSQRPFAQYFEGASGVRVQSIDDIVAWLQTCEYVTDSELFQARDFWQHPGAFEGRRRGDCEDFALWAWRKLAEIGIDAEFCVGRVIVDDRGRSIASMRGSSIASTGRHFSSSRRRGRRRG